MTPVLQGIVWTIVVYGAGCVAWISVASISDHLRYARDLREHQRDRAAVEAARAAVERADEATAPTLSPALRAELDQTPEWWDRQFEALLRERIPRDAAYHEGHTIQEATTYDTLGYDARAWCTDCGVPINREDDR